MPGRTLRLPPVEVLRELFAYDDTTGDLRWKFSVAARAKVGCVAGSMCGARRRVGINGKSYLVHRIVWKLVTGSDPEHQIDHVYGCAARNVFGGLRAATNAENAANAKRSIRNKSGFKGVYFHKGNCKWVVNINPRGRTIYLGSFSDVRKAHAVYVEAAKLVYGEFYNDGTYRKRKVR